MWMMVLTHMLTVILQSFERFLTEKYNKLKQWMDNNKVGINPDKNQLMVMRNKKAAN